MALSNTLADARLKTMNAVHRALLTVSGGRIGRSLGSMPVVELRVTGRKSGQERRCLLTAPLHEDGRYVLVASKAGDDRHPEWYLNLQANPDIELVVAGEAKLLTARTADAEEKAELWPRIVEAYQGYDKYREKTDRDIPVVVCEPRS